MFGFSSEEIILIFAFTGVIAFLILKKLLTP